MTADITESQDELADTGGSVWDIRLVVLTLGTFMVGTGNLVFIGVLGELASDLSVTEGTAGVLVTVYAATVVVGSPILVSVTGSVTRKRLLLGSVLVYAITNLTAAVLPTFRLLVLDRAVMGVGSALYTPVAVAVAADLAPAEKRGQAISLVMSGLTVAFVVGLPLGTAIGGYFGWRATFAFVGITGLLAFLGLQVFFPVIETTSEAAGLRSVAALRRPAIAINVGLIVLEFASTFVAVSFVGPLLRSITGFGTRGVTIIQFLLGIGGIVGTMLGGYGSDNWDTSNMLIGIAIGVILGLLPLWLVQPVSGSLLAIATAIFASVVGAGSLFALLPIQQSRLLQIAPDSRNVVLALTVSAVFLGLALGSTIGSAALTQVESYGNLGAVGAAFGGVGLLITVLMKSGNFASPSTA
ncbi:MFS transporter [Halorussus caseinilyticus]|uniref:MFS transporter n=1 Tax=Halorussus caseinilyticus TaxID=3034025 RepID=A0ABD5WJK3_9EURY|nr:MFS transporter [Halorussus sp. DT72]